MLFSARLHIAFHDNAIARRVNSNIKRAGWNINSSASFGNNIDGFLDSRGIEPVIVGLYTILNDIDGGCFRLISHER